MRSLFVVVALVSMSLVFKVNAAPCFAVSDGYPTAYEHARAVFIGEVVKIEPFNSDFTGPLGLMRYKVTFKVEYSWKGAGFQEIGLPELVVISEEIVTAPDFLKDCLPFVSFVQGKKYLVYADESEDKSLVVGIGNGSKPLWNASDDLKDLKKRNAFFARFTQ